MSHLIPSQLVRSNQTENEVNDSLDGTSNLRIDILTQSSEYAGDRIEEKKPGMIRI